MIHRRERVQLAAVAILMLGYLATYALALLHAREPAAPSGMHLELVLSFLALAAGGFIHACLLLGWRRALTMLGLSVVLSWVAETALLHHAYGGALRYTAVLGPALPGGVPAVIPLSWFTMTYASYVLANLILDGRLTWVRCAVWRVLWLSLITAVIHTAWDLSRNPTMSGRLGAWTWADGGEYFGVPYASYQAWIGITAAITLLYRLSERHIPLRPVGGPITLAAALVPVLLYALSAVADIVGGSPPPVRLIAAFAMGMPVFLALNRLVGAGAPRASGATRPWDEERAR